jgi:hypothetical protein
MRGTNLYISQRRVTFSKENSYENRNKYGTKVFFKVSVEIAHVQNKFIVNSWSWYCIYYNAVLKTYSTIGNRIRVSKWVASQV